MMTNENESKEYVCGFLFFKQSGLDQIPIFSTGNDDQKVLLILKDRPAWQAGNYNGIGGKVEAGEKPFDAMVRETYEECGLRINGWKFYAVMEGPGYKVHFYKAFANVIPEWQQKTSEPLAAFPVNKLPKNLINSNRYLIPMALENDMAEAIIKTQ